MGIPKRLADNVQWRRRAVSAARRSPSDAAALRRMCA